MDAQPHESEIEELRRRLDEAEETLRAIRSGEVDALLVCGPAGEKIYTLEGADHTYRALIESMQQGAVTLTSDGVVLYCNRCFATMVKRPHEKIIGSAMADFLPPEESSAFTALLGKGRFGNSQGEVQFRAGDDTLLPVYLAISPLPLAENETLCMVVTDLTGPKQRNELQETNRRKDEFLAMLSHELRNPLAPIRNAVGLLHLVDSSAEPLVFARDVIERQVQHMSRLVDDLLDVSRITLGKVELHQERIELATVIKRAVETSRPFIDAHQHELTVAVPSRGMEVYVDPTRLSQVISNLLTNAAKYSDPGGEIYLTAERTPAEIVVRVRDHGMGIPAALLPKLFDLFTQGDRTLARSEGGLGIGLTIARNLVEMHGGTIKAESDGPGKGSQFIVRLPAVKPADVSSRRQTDPGSQEPQARAQRILVVEDNEDGAYTIAMLLRTLGQQVHVVHSGTAAVQAAVDFQPTTILLDIGLPGMNGFDVAKRLRLMPAFDRVALIAMTGYGQDEDKQRAEEAGFDQFLVKPVEFGALKALLVAGPA